MQLAKMSSKPGGFDMEIKMKRRWRRFRHYLIKGILYVTWGAIAYQAMVYFVDPVKAETYKFAIEFWGGMRKVFFG